MRNPSRFSAIFDNPIFHALIFALWGVPLYVLLRWIPEWLSQYLSVKLPSISPEDQLIIGNFIEWFGVPYGLILALVLVNVWTQFEQTERAFDREGDTALRLYNTFHFASDESLKIEVGQKIKDYVSLVRQSHSGDKKETKELGYTEETLLEDIRKKIEELLRDKKEHDLAIILMELLNKLVDDRGDRISYERLRLPGPIRGLSITASLAWLIPFYSLKFTSPLVGPLFIVAVTLVVVSILLIIEDLDNPTEGAWRVRLISLTELEEKLEQENKLIEKN